MPRTVSPCLFTSVQKVDFRAVATSFWRVNKLVFFQSNCLTRASGCLPWRNVQQKRKEQHRRISKGTDIIYNWCHPCKKFTTPNTTFLSITDEHAITIIYHRNTNGRHRIFIVIPKNAARIVPKVASTIFDCTSQKRNIL